MARTSYVYAVINMLDGSMYIGWTIDPKGRWYHHRYRAKANWAGHLYSAMRHHGSDNFVFEVWETWPSEADARDAEIWFIAYLRARGVRLYNLTDGGEGATGRVVSEITRRRISEKAIGRPASEELREKRRVNATGRTHTDEERRKISTGQRGRVSVWKGKELPSEHRERIRQGALKRWARTRSGNGSAPLA